MLIKRPWVRLSPLGPRKRLVKQPKNRVVKPFLAATRFSLFLRQIALANFLSKYLSKIIFVEQAHKKQAVAVKLRPVSFSFLYLIIRSNSLAIHYNIWQGWWHKTRAIPLFLFHIACRLRVSNAECQQLAVVSDHDLFANLLPVANAQYHILVDNVTKWWHNQIKNATIW